MIVIHWVANFVRIRVMQRSQYMCAHKFKAITKAQVIEYYSKPFDLSDDIRFDEGFEGDQ